MKNVVSFGSVDSANLLTEEADALISFLDMFEGLDEGGRHDVAKDIVSWYRSGVKGKFSCFTFTLLKASGLCAGGFWLVRNGMIREMLLDLLEDDAKSSPVAAAPAALKATEVVYLRRRAA